jgi:putative transposase
MKTTKNPKRIRRRAPVNPVTASYRISDELWAVLEPLLPKHKNTHRFGGGRPRVPDRRCAEAIFYVLRTGCQWGALEATELCPRSTAHDRFQEWVVAGVFLKFWKAGVEQFDELKGLDWQWLSMDGAMTKAPFGGEKNWSQSYGPRQERRQAEPVDRGARRAGRAGGRRGQSPGSEVGHGHRPESGRQAPASP